MDLSGFRVGPPAANWGDGSALQTMNVPFNNGSGTGSFFVNHTYRDNPAAPDTAFTISQTVSDKAGATSVAQVTRLVVNNAPPLAATPRLPAIGSAHSSTR